MVSLDDVLDAMAESGCPVCRLTSNRVERFLDRLIYEQVNDPGIREALRDSQGLCSRHAWQLAVMPNSPGLGLALVYRDVIQDLISSVEARDGRSASPLGSTCWALAGILHAARRLLRPGPPNGSHAACPACSYAAEVEDYALRALMTGLDQHGERVAHQLAESDGLCLKHLRLAMDIDRWSPSARRLAEDAQPRLRALDQDLAEYIRHQDYRFNEGEPGPWASAWRRALAFVNGDRSRS